ncbi:MAG: tripartite tricarboxylate transporter substrate-binding protein, partial [Pigmentiphaga sp.]|nr:tripartite tricarboxylate transporter substrate-binding protein [Pigmentiphaga sp.]
MKIKHGILGGVGAAMLMGMSVAAAQTDYPSQPIRIVVGFPPGSSTDVGPRILANTLSELLNQTVVVENRPGASSDIAARHVAGARPDGYTLFVVTIANAINTASKNANFTNI